MAARALSWRQSENLLVDTSSGAGRLPRWGWRRLGLCKPGEIPESADEECYFCGHERQKKKKKKSRSWKEVDFRIASKNILTSCQMTQEGRALPSLSSAWGEDCWYQLCSSQIVWAKLGGTDFMKKKSSIRSQRLQNLQAQQFHMNINVVVDYSRVLRWSKGLLHT